ncbi:MAG: hypothetical protein JWN98_1703 [Abditibacteriota bacterium]|jgi:Uma2 family endonuclease|nr:hypothetical protein [Abditibacteriota bacterium]
MATSLSSSRATLEPLGSSVVDRLPEPHPIHWDQERYCQMVRLGWFEDKRVELVDGRIIEMAAILGPHATALSLSRVLLDQIFGATHYVRVQMPLDLSDDSQPEPDMAVVIGNIRDFTNNHPSIAVLTIEVSVSTLAYDLGRKADLYARAGIADYWVLDVEGRRLMVHREPREGKYQSIQTLNQTDSIAPLEKPDASIQIVDLLP